MKLYVLDPNGKFFSDDGKVRYTLLEGEEAKRRLNDGKIYLNINEYSKGEKIAFETTLESKHRFRSMSARQDYIIQCEKEYRVDMSELLECLTYDKYPSEKEEDEDYLLFSMCKRLLTEKEWDVAYLLWSSSDKKLSDEMCARILGINKRTVQQRRERIKEKLKSAIGRGDA